jgi:endonuclease-3
MNNAKIIMDYLDLLFPNPKCELEYKKDYELLIATVLSAQCKDKRVNEVTRVLFSLYDIFSLSKEDENTIRKIITPLGNQNKKAKYIIDIAKSLVENYNGVVPCNREYLESLNGVGRKTANIVLNNVFNIPTFAVDTHVFRVANRLGIIGNTPREVEMNLQKYFPKDSWGRLHHQLVLFGRYYCTARNPLCDNCKLKNICKKNN